MLESRQTRKCPFSLEDLASYFSFYNTIVSVKSLISVELCQIFVVMIDVDGKICIFIILFHLHIR